MSGSSDIKVCRNCGRSYRYEEDFLTRTSRWRMGMRNTLYFNCSCGSTLTLPQGSHDWYRPEHLLRPQAREFFNVLAIGDVIPQIPHRVIELQEAVADVQQGPQIIADLLRAEPYLATETIRMANAARLTQHGEIKTIEHAVVFIGRRALGDLILAASLRSFDLKTKVFSMKQYWLESFVTGMIGEHIAGMAPRNFSADQIYLACSLANIGKFVAALCFPDSIDEVARCVDEQRVPWSNAEFMMTAPRHEILGEIACVFWALPDWVLRANTSHHGKIDADSTDEERDIVRIVVFANQACHWIMEQHHRIDERLLQDSYQRLRLTQPIEDVLKSLKPLADKAKALLTHEYKG